MWHDVLIFVIGSDVIGWWKHAYAREHVHMMMNLMVEAVCTSQMSVYFYKTTWYYIPEGSHLHAHCNENVKSHFPFS